MWSPGTPGLHAEKAMVPPPGSPTSNGSSVGEEELRLHQMASKIYSHQLYIHNLEEELRRRGGDAKELDSSDRADLFLNPQLKVALTTHKLLSPREQQHQQPSPVSPQSPGKFRTPPKASPPCTLPAPTSPPLTRLGASTPTYSSPVGLTPPQPGFSLGTPKSSELLGGSTGSSPSSPFANILSTATAHSNNQRSRPSNQVHWSHSTMGRGLYKPQEHFSAKSSPGDPLVSRTTAGLSFSKIGRFPATGEHQQVLVQISPGRTLAIEADHDDTLADIALSLQDLLAIPVQERMFRCHGHVLSDLGLSIGQLSQQVGQNLLLELCTTDNKPPHSTPPPPVPASNSYESKGGNKQAPRFSTSPRMEMNERQDSGSSEHQGTGHPAGLPAGSGVCDPARTQTPSTSQISRERETNRALKKPQSTLSEPSMLGTGRQFPSSSQQSEWSEPGMPVKSSSSASSTSRKKRDTAQRSSSSSQRQQGGMQRTCTEDWSGAAGLEETESIGSSTNSIEQIRREVEQNINPLPKPARLQQQQFAESGAEHRHPEGAGQASQQGQEPLDLDDPRLPPEYVKQAKLEYEHCQTQPGEDWLPETSRENPYMKNLVQTYGSRADGSELLRNPRNWKREVLEVGYPKGLPPVCLAANKGDSTIDVHSLGECPKRTISFHHVEAMTVDIDVVVLGGGGRMMWYNLSEMTTMYHIASDAYQVLSAASNRLLTGYLTGPLYVQRTLDNPEGAMKVTLQLSLPPSSLWRAACIDPPFVVAIDSGTALTVWCTERNADGTSFVGRIVGQRDFTNSPEDPMKACSAIDLCDMFISTQHPSGQNLVKLYRWEALEGACLGYHQCEAPLVSKMGGVRSDGILVTCDGAFMSITDLQSFGKQGEPKLREEMLYEKDGKVQRVIIAGNAAIITVHPQSVVVWTPRKKGGCVIC